MVTSRDSSGSVTPIRNVGTIRTANSNSAVTGSGSASGPSRRKKKPWSSGTLASANSAVPASARAKASTRPRGDSRSARCPPARLPQPRPAMKTATISVTEKTSAPLKKVSSRCQTIW